MSKLSERAMLSSLHIGSWSGRMYDKAVSDDVSQIKKADEKAGRYNKALVDPKVLRLVSQATSTARTTHHLLTLPWDDGARILAAKGHQHYTDSMRTCRLSMEAAVADFIRFYPTYIGSTDNKLRLGTMYSAEDYPQVKDLKAMYYLDVEIKPVPEAGDFRTKLSDAHTKAIMKDIEDRTEQRLKSAMNDVFERIVDATGKMVERLRAYKPATDAANAEGNFRDSLVYNINELADLLPALNINGDPRLDALRNLLKKDLVDHSPEVLKVDKKIRKDTADKAEAILKKVKQYMA